MTFHSLASRQKDGLCGISSVSTFPAFPHQVHSRAPPLRAGLSSATCRHLSVAFRMPTTPSCAQQESQATGTPTGLVETNDDPEMVDKVEVAESVASSEGSDESDDLVDVTSSL